MLGLVTTTKAGDLEHTIDAYGSTSHIAFRISLQESAMASKEPVIIGIYDKFSHRYHRVVVTSVAFHDYNHDGITDAATLKGKMRGGLVRLFMVDGRPDRVQARVCVGTDCTFTIGSQGIVRSGTLDIK